MKLLLSPPCLRPNIPTGSTGPMPRSQHEEIFSGIRMPLRTVSNDEESPSDILSASDCLKVGRVDAEMVTAKMIDCQPLGNLSDKEFIREAMGINRSALIPREEDSVSVLCRSFPAPAFRSFPDMFPKPNLSRSSRWSHV